MLPIQIKNVRVIDNSQKKKKKLILARSNHSYIHYFDLDKITFLLNTIHFH